MYMTKMGMNSLFEKQESLSVGMWDGMDERVCAHHLFFELYKHTDCPFMHRKMEENFVLI